jgi:hypothetical protein
MEVSTIKLHRDYYQRSILRVLLQNEDGKIGGFHSVVKNIQKRDIVIKERLVIFGARLLRQPYRAFFFEACWQYF